MTKQSLESEINAILSHLQDSLWSNSGGWEEAKSALLKTVDRYVEEVLLKLIDETPVFGPSHPQTTIYKNDLRVALRQQVKDNKEKS